MPKIEIIAGGIWGGDGEVPVGSVHDVASVPDGWAEKVRVLTDDAPADAVPLTNDDADRAAIIADLEALGAKVDKRKSTDTLAAELAELMQA